MVTDYAKDFISGLLVKDYHDRMTLEEALQHPWFKYDMKTLLQK